MSYKPTRTFSAYEGDYSVDNAGPEALKRDLDNLMAMFDPDAVHSDGSPGGISADNFDFDLSDPSMSSKIGSADIEGLSADPNVFSQLAAIVNVLLTHSNLSDSSTLSHIGGLLNQVPMNAQGIVNQLYAMIVDRYTKAESDSALLQKTNPLIKTLNYNPKTGVLEAVTSAGTKTQVFDLNIEKIPASIAIVEEGAHIYVRITNTDGTYTQSDVTALLTQYRFVSSGTIRATVSSNSQNATVTMELQEGAIRPEHLESQILSTVVEASESAQISAEAAAESSASAQQAAEDALEAKKQAAQSASDASSSAASAAASAENAAEMAEDADRYAVMSKSYAVGATGSRPGEDIDNAKWYYEHAKAAVNGDGVSVFIQLEEPSVDNCIWIKPLGGTYFDGTLLLETSDSTDGNYFVEVGNELKAIENAVDTDAELADGNFRLIT